MKEFTYTVNDKLGIHARPAGMLVKTAKSFESDITIEKDGKTIGAKKLMMLMGLGIKCGDTVTVKVEGADEDNAVKAMKDFFTENL